MMSATEKGEKLELPLVAEATETPQSRTRIGQWIAKQPKSSRILVKILAVYFGICYVLYPTFDGLQSSLKAGHGCHGLTGVSDIDGYLEGLMGRGWKVGSPRPHGAEAFHGKNDHKHDHHHGKDKHRPHPIGPREAERIFLATPNNVSARAALKRYTNSAHMAGTGDDHLSALNLKAEWETLLGLPTSAPYDSVYEAGSSESQDAVYGSSNRTEAKVWVDTYYPYLNSPVSRSLSILLPDGDGKIEWSAKLREDIVDGDSGSLNRDSVPTFHGLSISGNVTGKVVYVGYGRKQDFDLLAEKGISLEGHIALVKYGGNFRGLKIKAAQEAGAVACLIFSDPGDDGEITLENGYEAYPNGPARQPSSVQRGSVQFISKYPGDPSTPGYPSYENATRVPGGNQPSIPSLPISYEDAIPLLNTLKGHGTPASELGPFWEGGLKYLGVEYWTGPGDRDVNFVNEVDTKITPIWNTMATIPGHITDEIVILGNHRDAWVLGGADPSSGTATQHELLRGLSALLKKGWKPMRTIIVASWDAEEFGLIGSTEWVEDFGEWLQAHSAAYLNLDVSVGGSKWSASASPSLARLIRNAAEEINHPTDESRNLWSARSDGGDWSAHQMTVHGMVEEDVESLFESDTGVRPLGSGSDYTAFLMGYGIASTDMGFKGGPTDPVYHYHSIYDSFTWQEKYCDAEFGKHVAAAKILGLMTLRLVDGIILPINVTQYAMDLSGYQAKVEHIASEIDLSSKLNFANLTDAISQLQDDTGRLDAQADAAMKKLRKLLPGHGDHYRKKSHGASHDGERDHHDVEKLSKHNDEYHHGKHDGKKHHDKHGKHHDDDHHNKHPKHPRRHPSPDPRKMKEIKKVLLELRGINQKLKNFESGFLSKEGIKDREWFKHKGTAPGIWLGYGATTFPALTEALTIDKSAELAQHEIDELSSLISAMGDRVRA